MKTVLIHLSENKELKRYFCLLITGLLCFAVYAQERAHVVIVAGQSNTDGRVPVSDLPEYIRSMGIDSTGFTKGAYKYCKISQNRVDGKFVPFWPRRNRWGYDAVTYYLLEQLYQKDFYVIKWAVGGTSITPENTSSRGGHWSADPTWLAQNTPTAKKGKSLLLSFAQQISNSITKTLSRLPEGYHIDAFFWHQGESDSDYGPDYYDNLKNVLAYVRTHLTRKTGEDYSELPFIFGSVAKSNKRYNAEVEAAMKRLASEDKNAYLVDMSKATLLKDRLHFDKTSAEYLGRQMYETMLRVSSANVTVAQPPFDIDLWEQGLPNSNGKETEGYDDKKHNYKPSVRVFLPVSKKPVKAILICPGGGYDHLAMKDEGYDWALYFNKRNMAAIVLKYRMPNGNPEVPVSDACEAMRYIRAHAEEWNIIPDSIGVMGSSAGGHLASTIATHASAKLRPAFQILLYPVITMEEKNAHKGSKKQFLGENPNKKLVKRYSNELQVDKRTSGAFIALSGDDQSVKPIHSENYHKALRRLGIASEMHIYSSGKHGWGYNKRPFAQRAEMMEDLENWLMTL